jgi:RNA 3'-terminal phosphate cyclase (ATP)
MGNAASSISITGGTHVPWAPSFDFLKYHWMKYLIKLGIDTSLDMDMAGFYPQGGGRIHATIRPTDSILPLNLTNRGALKQIRGLSAVANLDRRIAERQRAQILRRLSDRYPLNDIRIVQLPSRFKGTTVCLICEFEYSQCCYFALGERGKPAERVADEAIEKIEYFLSTDATIDEYLADQILLPLTIAKSKSSFSTSKITRHLLTNVEIIQEFLPASIDISGEINSPGMITIDPGK